MTSSMPTRQPRRSSRRSRTDRGAALIVAIGFVVMIGAIAAGLSSLIVSSMNNRITLQALRDRHYAADGAIEDAITVVRGLDRSTTGSCTAQVGSSISTINAVVIRVDWQNLCGAVRADDGAVVSQRNVVFSACINTGVACPSGQVIVRAQLNFEQAGSGAVTKTYVQSWSVNQ